MEDKRVIQSFRLPKYLVDWLDKHPINKTHLVELALKSTFKLEDPKSRGK